MGPSGGGHGDRCGRCACRADAFAGAMGHRHRRFVGVGAIDGVGGRDAMGLVKTVLLLGLGRRIDVPVGGVRRDRVCRLPVHRLEFGRDAARVGDRHDVVSRRGIGGRF